MVDLEALIIFGKVAEAKSFSEAARILRMPASTVSRRIAELEHQLGVRLLERSTRIMRLTDIGSEVLAHAQRCAEVGNAVEMLVSDQKDGVSGMLRLSAPPTISDLIVTPFIASFQKAHPNVRVQFFVTDRNVDLIREGIDLAFRCGPNRDSSMVVRKVLSYRHQLVASPKYLSRHHAPSTPEELLAHRLIAFSQPTGEHHWILQRADRERKETVTFLPSASMNDYTALAVALVGGSGIGELPSVMLPDLLRRGKLIEVMPKWRFGAVDLSLLHLSNRQIARPVRLFMDQVAELAPKLFPALPT